MSNNKDIVVTVYGHDRIIDKIAVSYSENIDADTYCDTINSLDLNENSWVFAKTITENTPCSLDSLLPMRFDVIVEQLDARSLQSVLREVDSQELAKVLKGASESVKEKIFNNMSVRAVQMLKEDMEYMGPILKTDVKESQEKIISIVRYLLETGEILINHSGDVIL